MDELDSNWTDSDWTDGDWSSWTPVHEVEWSSLDYDTHWDTSSAFDDGSDAATDGLGSGPFHDGWLDHAALDHETWQAWDPRAEDPTGPTATTGPWTTTNGPFDDGFR